MSSLLCFAVATAFATAPQLVAAAPSPAPAARGESRAHVIFDDTTRPPQAGITAGGRAQPLLHAKVAVGDPGRAATNARAAGASGSAARTEVLGFAQSGEVTSGSWQGDLRLELLTTVAYFGVNFNGDGSISNDAGYQGWWSSQATNLINAAHVAGDRVVLTIKAFGSSGIESLVGSEPNRQAAINNVIGQLQARGGDGVNVDFEGFTPTVSATDFTTFVAELRSGLNARVPTRAYLTVDTYGSSAQGGSMMSISGLHPYVDAFDVMSYDTTGPCSAQAGPNAPLANYPYSDSDEMNQYLRLVPPWQVILGIPYYGYKWSVTQPVSRAATSGCGGADTYSGVLGDFGCAQQLAVHWDASYSSPWATWWSPASGDPCGGNHNSWRELYFDNAQSLGMKYDLVNGDGLRGIGIWALGYDSGSSDLWNVLASKFHCPYVACSGSMVTGDFNGDHKAEAAAVTPAGTRVVLSTGSGFSAPASWTAVPFYGTRATLSGDVTGDGKTDLVAVNEGSTWVMTSTGVGFSPPAMWSSSPFFGTKATLVADVNGDGRADLVAVNQGSTWVMLATPSGFAAPSPWSGTPFYGSRATLIGDINGDGRADLIAINDGSTWVMLSTGTGFSAPQPWSGTPFYGSKATLIADVNGDGKSDLVAVNDGNTFVMLSAGSGFSAPQAWSTTAFYGSRGTLSADVNGDGTSDLVAFNDASVWVMPSTGTGFAAPTLWRDGSA